MSDPEYEKRMMKQLCVLIDVKNERERQDNKWGGPDHDDLHTLDDWTKFIEFRTAAIFEPRFGHTYKQSRELLVQIAALAVAAIESIDRKGSTCLPK